MSRNGIGGGGGCQIAKILDPLDLFPFPWQPDEDRGDLSDVPTSSVPALSDITADQDNAAALSPRVRAEVQARARRWPPLQPSQECRPHRLSCVSLHTEQACFFSPACFRCWIKQPRVGARTTARCIAETVYQCHRVLGALNTATVFCASLFSLPPRALSVWILCWCSCLSLMPAKKSGRG